MLEGKGVLVTGGTGSFGKAFVRNILAPEFGASRIVVFSRDELKQSEMREEAPFRADPRLRFYIGDVRDKARLDRAMEGIQVVVHAAALKQVPAAEMNPFEAIRTNILGAQNVIESALDKGVEHVVALSTDKAAAPINLYGATKLCSDKLFVAANHFRGARKLKFTVVRYGNVVGTRGSVVLLFLKKRKERVLPITDPAMTRFTITLQESVELVLFALRNAWGGEIFVPKIPSLRILDLAAAIAPDARTEIVGIRAGEKLHEEMITVSDSIQTLEFDRHYVITPSLPLWDVNQYLEANRGQWCARGFSYSSDTNLEFLSVGALRQLIVDHVDPAFIPGCE
jgi:UDP-N-acetylglucosamine 4,6-dehydratase/5-epimerase